MNESQFNAIPVKERMNRHLEGLAYYASVHKPNFSGSEEFGSPPVYEVKLALDTEAELQKAKEYGHKILDADNYIPYPHVKIQAKIKLREQDIAEGKKLEDRIRETKPDVIDSMQNEVPPSILIGNGSRILTKYMTYWHQMSPKHGVGTYLNKVQVLNLVPYEPKDSFVKDSSGFVVPTGGQVSTKSTPVAEPMAANAGKSSKKKVTVDDLEDVLDSSIFD